jgi:superfamily II DNA helicase RecQ
MAEQVKFRRVSED